MHVICCESYPPRDGLEQLCAEFKTKKLYGKKYINSFNGEIHLVSLSIFNACCGLNVQKQLKGGEKTKLQLRMISLTPQLTCCRPM